MHKIQLIHFTFIPLKTLYYFNYIQNFPPLPPLHLILNLFIFKNFSVIYLFATCFLIFNVLLNFASVLFDFYKIYLNFLNIPYCYYY